MQLKCKLSGNTHPRRKLDDIIDRCRELRLRLVRPPERIKTETLMMITVQTMNYLHAGNHRVAL